MYIQNTKELLQAIELVGVSGAKIYSDGAINLKDIPVAVGLLTNFGMFVSTVEGIKEIPVELKDLNQDELVELGMAVFNMVQNIRNALLPVPVGV